MELTAALDADLALVSDVLDDPATGADGDITDTVRQLETDVRLAVRSYLGLTVTVSNVQNNDEEPAGIALRFTLLDADVEPGDIATSLRLPVPAPAPVPVPTDSHAPGGPTVAVILYASTPGAFVDLAADLSFLTDRQLADTDLDQHRGLPAQPDITGLVAADSVIHEATGVLIARGRTRDQADTDLDVLAVGAGTDRHVEALRILDALP